MRAKIHMLRANWTPLSIGGADTQELSERIEKMLQSWEGTKYVSGQRFKGEGADCIGFGFAAIDEIDGRERAASPSLPADTALHNPDTARQAVKDIRRLYAPARLIRPAKRGLTNLQPLDILVVGPSAGGPGHLMLVGPQRNTIWHCIQNSGVSRTGWGLTTGFERLQGVYRLGDRERWLR